MERDEKNHARNANHSPPHSEEVRHIKFGLQIKNDSAQCFFCSLGNTNLQGNFEAYLSSVILPCMKEGGGTLIAEGEVSKKFLSGLKIIQDIYHSWYTEFERVTVKGESSRAGESLKKERVGAFFSGGLDSFYTHLKRQDEITDLIFIHGTDISFDDTKLRDTVSARINEIALHFDKNLIEIKTNINIFLKSYGLSWGIQAHGAALAAVAHLLSYNFRRIYIPSTQSYGQMIPWASHPLLDPLWSSDSLELFHDGAEATRLDKVAQISKNEKVLSCLRVCYSNINSCYNCSKCEKCVQTMISLKTHNAIERCVTFNNEICIKDVYKIDFIDGLPQRMFAETNLMGLEKTLGNKELKRALRRILNRPKWISKIKRVRSRLKADLLKILRDTLPNRPVNYLRLVRSWLNNKFRTHA